MAGLALGASQLIMFISLGVIFYIGAVFIDNGILVYDDLFVVVFAIMLSA